MLTHGPHEVLRQFQGVKNFARDQQLRLQTPGSRVLDFEGNPLKEEERAGASDRAHSLKSLVIRDREHPFAENLIGDDSGAPDATLPVLAKVLSLIDVLQSGGTYDLVYQLWSQFTMIASRMNVNVAWFRDQVLVSNFLFHVSVYLCALASWCCVLVNHFEWDVSPYPFSCFRVGEGAWSVQHRI